MDYIGLAAFMAASLSFIENRESVLVVQLVNVQLSQVQVLSAVDRPMDGWLNQ